MTQNPLDSFFKNISLAALVLILSLFYQGTVGAQSTGVIHVETQNRMVKFFVEYAITPEEKAKGLMHRTGLPQNHGMLFVYQTPQDVTMWMKDTPMSLDMIFINRRGLIRHIEKNTQPNSTRHIHSGGKVSAVLEVSAGTVDNYGIKVGDRVHIGQ